MARRVSNKKAKQSIIDCINNRVSYYKFSVEWDFEYESCIGIVDNPYDGLVDHEYQQGTVSIKGGDINK